MPPPPRDEELTEAARTFQSAAERAASHSLKDLLAPAVEALRDLAELADPTPRYVPEPTGSRRRKIMDQVRATVTSGLAPAVRAVLEQQARFNEQIVAALLDVVRRLQASDDAGALRAKVEELERRLAALERPDARPVPPRKPRAKPKTAKRA
ncbi:MAG TPA: hypothetical protein VIG99_06810 [Myxococcaceae bacterium]|jgi:hypothetical protein